MTFKGLLLCISAIHIKFFFDVLQGNISVSWQPSAHTLSHHMHHTTHSSFHPFRDIFPLHDSFISCTTTNGLLTFPMGENLVPCPPTPSRGVVMSSVHRLFTWCSFPLFFNHNLTIYCNIYCCWQKGEENEGNSIWIRFKNEKAGVDRQKWVYWTLAASKETVIDAMVLITLVGNEFSSWAFPWFPATLVGTSVGSDDLPNEATWRVWTPVVLPL